jgi:glycosyltransferase involved in cell wall biosynthesis
VNVPHPDVFQIFKRSDVFVRGFGFDSYGLSRIEAIWAGLPVVATRSGETRGMLLYDFADVSALTRQLERALSEPPSDLEHWSALYRKEAEANLLAIRERLGLID